MDAPTNERVPTLPDELLEQWPTPDGVRPSTWRRMSTTRRQQWLVHHTYEQRADGWALREDTRNTPTSRRFQQAVTTIKGAHTFIEPMIEDLRAADEIMDVDLSGQRQTVGGGLGGVLWFVVAVLFAIVLTIVVTMLTTDLFGNGTSTDDAVVTDGSPAATDVADDEATAASAPGTVATDETTTAATVTTGPVPLTEGTWRFFAAADETSALYDFAFFDDGTFHEDDAAHNAGVYAVDGDQITLELVRVATVTASDGTSERNEEVSWNETFRMTRTGDTMSGSWERDNWIFTFEDGFVVRPSNPPETGIFARPELPEDPG